jgi:hypothetical protein
MLLEPIKTLKANSPLVEAKICPTILSASAIDMCSSILKINMQSNAIVAMEAPFHVNPLIRLWQTLEASRIL